jgi:hypothetical protein
VFLLSILFSALTRGRVPDLTAHTRVYGKIIERGLEVVLEPVTDDGLQRADHSNGAAEVEREGDGGDACSGSRGLPRRLPAKCLPGLENRLLDVGSATHRVLADHLLGIHAHHCALRIAG